jgi:hypothetical protein
MVGIDAFQASEAVRPFERVLISEVQLVYSGSDTRVNAAGSRALLLAPG